MASKMPKQFLPLAGKPVLYHTVKAFVHAFPDIHIILVYPENSLALVQEALATFTGNEIIFVPGGDVRFESVKHGLSEIRSPSVVFVHDGVRPLVSAGLIQKCYEQALSLGSAIPSLPLKESIRKIDGNDSLAADRTAYCSIQTPQTFLSEVLLLAFNTDYDPSFTDEATVVEKAGGHIHLISGEEQNIKITEPYDLWLAEQIMKERNPGK